MSVPARLLAVRLQGFKSFASRTVVEFGGGISAVVGPNGAGKSNLADALRWALGEQGRALRSRRSEDVIFAGSEAKPALGMAEVTVVVENADRLLPVDYGVVELGRRLFRSGENDYLLNGTRVRLRDLEELLDSARLADNAFLFIGQGMVDQALSLRPEERRPLFEEVAGVRRHDRRKKAAQERLAESEANLARVRDILAELRPQARRLALQAERQAARDEAAAALAEAIVAAGRWRWYEAARRLAMGSERRAVAQAEVDAAIAESRGADEDAIATTEGLEARLREARKARVELDEARAALQVALVADARRAAERGALARDRARLEAEEASVGARIAGARRSLAVPVPPAPEALPPADGVRGAAGGSAAGDVEAPLVADIRERLALRRQALREEEAAYERTSAVEREARETLGAVSAERDAAAAAADAALEAAEDQRRTVAALVGKRRAAEEGLRAARSDAARLSERMVVLDERLRDPGEGPLPAGAEPLAADLYVEERLRAAVEAALGAAVRGVIVDGQDGDGPPAGVPLVFRDLHGPAVAPGEASALVERVVAAGGGRLIDGLRADPTGVGRRVLERSVWVPELAAARDLVALLPPGWVITTLAGEAIDGRGVLAPAVARSVLGLLEQRVRLAAEGKPAEAAVRVAESALAALEAALAEAGASAEEAQRLAAKSQAKRGAKLEAEAAAARRHELLAREAAWSRAQRDRLRSEVSRLEALAGPGSAPGRRRSGGPRSTETQGVGLAAWAAYRGALEERQRLEGSLAVDLQRSDVIAAELAAAASAEAAAAADGDRHVALLAELEARVRDGEARLSDLDLDEGSARDRLHAAEARGRAARERLRLAEGHARAAEVEELEARMGLDTAREQLLVELAGLGPAGLAGLGARRAPDRWGRERDGGAEESASLLEGALDAVTDRWAAAPPPGDAPSPGRLAALRRRYHELGEVNPFAADEHAEVQGRLSGLEAQRDDLDRAIVATRRLIGDLERLIVEQFQETFRALETVFDRRFAQLFGGGHARLALTDPDDPVSSGVEIIARPPGKKAQPLAMLSGGERALTAVALLFAMLEVRPVPFCVLDEVDAALDEANIGRFAEALRELAAGIQFVVITHNRGTIEQADALYGVTIGEDAVSRVVSLRLEGDRGNAKAPRTDGEMAPERDEPPRAVEPATRAGRAG